MEIWFQNSKKIICPLIKSENRNSICFFRFRNSISTPIPAFFNHCTFVSISNYYLSHKKPLIVLSNTNEKDVSFNSLIATIDNSIVYGEGGFVDDEILTARKVGTGFIANMNQPQQ